MAHWNSGDDVARWSTRQRGGRKKLEGKEERMRERNRERVSGKRENEIERVENGWADPH